MLPVALVRSLIRCCLPSLLILAAFALSLCGERAEAKEHQIVVDGPNASINGVPLTRAVPYKGDSAVVISYEAAVRVLGRPTRSGYGHNLLLVCWDSIGLTMLCDGDHPKEGEIWNFALRLQKADSPRNMDPKSQFTGSLRVDGIEINSTTRLEDIVPALVARGFQPLQGSSCYGRKNEHYGLTVAARRDGLVHIFIFDTRDLIEAPKKRR